MEYQYLVKNGVELAKDLCLHLKSSDWLPFREIEIPGCDNGRVDVAAVKPHAYSSKDLRCYEVKVSRADFFSDVNSNKWRKYLNVFHRVYFAVPQGLVTKNEVPPDAGLIVRGPNGWHVVKGAKGHVPPKLTADSVLALLYRGHEEHIEMRRLADKITAEENLPLAEKAKSIGYQISRRLAGGKREEMESWASRIIKLCEELTGLDCSSREYSSESNRDKIETALMSAIDFCKFRQGFIEMGNVLSHIGRGYGVREKHTKALDEFLKETKKYGIDKNDLY